MPEENDFDNEDQIEEEKPREPDFVEIGGSPAPGLTLRHVLRGHTGRINRIAWSPDGKYLASPSTDKTIRIWDVSTGECVRVLEGHTDVVECVAWSPDCQRLVSASNDNSVKIWNVNDGKEIRSLYKHKNFVIGVAWSPNGKLIASGGTDGDNLVCIWNAETGRLMRILEEFHNGISEIAWFSDSQKLVTADGQGDIHLWDINTWTKIWHTSIGEFKLKSSIMNAIALLNNKEIALGDYEKNIYLIDANTGRLIRTLEAHTDTLCSLSFSDTYQLLASKSHDQTVRIWNCKTWNVLSIISESSAPQGLNGISFHPKRPILATLGEKDILIRIWELDETILLSQAKENVNYTTAKLVLVGDSGVGKTGLGWRLAHGEFKEHASTHGQQFWSIPELGLKRKDGTDCEAVLWDLAGQHVYRQVHSIFLDNVSAALVLFDPTNRQDPLKGAQFWLEQLKGKGKLPPTVLVGARVDRGAPALSQAELDQFCQRYGITGGYISTSAMKGDGLDELMELLKNQIPWDEMTATVTTVTFKKIKDYVLSLKEKPDRKGVLVSPQELRKQLEGTDKDWEFNDAEMMTAVGHLETHGYVFILHNSAGEQFILLTPDVLVNLAASIMLLADKNVRELGAVSETELMGGKVPFDELKGLEKAEQQILIDAAILRFLEHNICFRDTFGNDTLLIFPSLIKQKRPMKDDLPATDDISYVVRGRVENIYASLVVLLGYTPTFSRMDQWQNQAQYEMEAGQVCGFRLIEEHEGEIELVLYYGDALPQAGHDKFQELFEQFLYQRDVDVTRFPPAVCPKGHPIERNTFISRMREGQQFVFCYQCDDKVPLPVTKPVQTIGISASPWLQREEAMARLRSSYEKHLTNIKSYRRTWAVPRCYISRLPEQNEWAEKILIRDLKDAGVFVVDKVEDLKAEDFVILLNTSAYEKAYRNSSPILANDTSVISARLTSNNKKVLSLLCEGKMERHEFKVCAPGDFCDNTHYSVSLFNLVMGLYAIPLDHKGFEPLRQSLHEQWEQSLSRLPVVEKPIPPKKRFDVALSFPGEYRKQVEAIANKLAEKLGQERVFYDKYHEAELARPNLDTHLQTIYHDQSELIIVFLCAEYEKKEWCGLEWRALRDLIKKKETAIIMPMRFDQTEIPGLFSIDGYIDIAKRNADEVSQLILQRLEMNRND